jgi:hypothetical protein
MNVIVKSVGRTGSMLMTRLISASTNLKLENDEDLGVLETLDYPFVFQTHEEWLPKNVEDFHFIFSKRKSVFDQMISQCVARCITKEPVRYTEIVYQPAVISLDYFEYNYSMYKKYNELFNDQCNLNWSSVDILYYEDWINDYSLIPYVSKDQKMDIDSIKNPRRNRDLILNYEELKERYECIE